MRIAIIGSPRAGKTTLAKRLGEQLHLPVVHSDDLIPLGWSSSSSAVAGLIELVAEQGGIFEGVAVVRALRKLLEETEGRPVDRVIVLAEPRLKLSPGQERMRLGCETMLRRITAELERRRVELTHGEPS